MADRTLKVEIIGDASSLNKALGSVSKSTTGASKAFGQLAKAGALVGAALGVAAAVGIKKSIDAASDLQEQVNKANVVFAGSQKQVLAWSKGLESSFGLSQRAALEAAGTFGNMLVPMGFARDAAAEMSKKMVELSGDMASFNNASPEETLLAIRSGLAGEAEPLRKFGVFLTAARIEQEALTETGKKSVKTLTEQEKATARYNLILKDTKDTQGDFARSAGESMANQMRIMKASFEDVSASLGKIFLPLVIKAFGVINKYAIPALQSAVDWLGKFFGAFNEADGVKAKLGVVKGAFVDLGKSLVKSIDQALFGFDKLMALPGGGAAPIRVQGLIDKFTAAFATLDWNKVGDAIINGLVNALKASGALAKQLADTIRQAVDQIQWEEVGKSMGPGLAAAIAAAFVTLTDVTFWVRNWDLALSVALVAFGGVIGKFAGTAARVALAPLARLGEGLIGGLATAINNALPRLGPIIIVGIGRAISLAIAALAGLWGKLDAAVLKVAARLGPLLTTVLKVGFVYAAVNAIASLLSGLVSGFARVLAWIQGLRPKVIGAFGDAGSWLYSAGVAIIEGLWSGLKSKWEAVKGWLGGLGSAIVGLKGPPAKDVVLLHEVGQLIMQGLANGMQVGWGKVEQLLDGLSPTIKDKASALVEDMKQAILDKQSVFASAFDGLVAAADAAFDRITDSFQTKTEKKIAAQDARRAAADRQQALREAQTDLATAQAGGDPEEIKRAAQAVNDALFAIQRAADEKTAEQERRQYEASRERQKVNFDRQLGALETQLEKGRISVQQYRARVLALFDKFDVPFKNSGKALGAALSAGLHESFADAGKAAASLIETIANAISKAKFVVNIKVNVDRNDGPGRQHGGYVRRGMSYVVGERRPEVFVPSQSGRIIPSLAGGGDTSAEIHTHVYLDSTQIAEVIRREYLRFEKRNGRTAL